MASNEYIDKEFAKWKLYHQTHGKSISELSPEINILMRKYAVKKLYDLSQSQPSVKAKVEDYFKLVFTKGQAEKIAKNFDVDKYCIYEDYTTLIEKIYESAEDEYQSRILQNDFSNHLQLIAVYRLLVDMIELVNIWKEKDENIQKFQMYCKYRVVLIIDKKKNKRNFKGYDMEIEQEFKDLKEEVKKDKADSLMRSRTCMENNSVQVDEKQLKEEFVFTPPNQELKQNKTILINQRGDANLGKYGPNVTGVQNPYSGISLDLNQPQHQEQSSTMPQNQEQPFPQKASALQQQQFAMLQQQRNLQQQYQDNPKQLQAQGYGVNVNQLPKPSIQIQSKNAQPFPATLPPSQNTHQKPLPQRRKIINKNDQYIEEIEKMKRELLNEAPDDSKKKKDEQFKTQAQKVDVNKKKESNLISNVFKRVSTPMLDDYVYDINRVRISMPIKYQSNDYFGVNDYFRKTLIQTTIKEIQNNNYSKALENCEDILYCLTNIMPK